MRRRLLLSLLGAVLVVILFALAATGAGASRPTAFGDGGRLVTDFGTYPQTTGSIEDLAVAPDGRLAIATQGAEGQEIQIAMLNADGSPDRSFSADGLLAPQLEAGPPFRREPVRLAFDGSSLLVAGTVRGARSAEVEIRGDGPGGEPDRNFGKEGVASVGLPGVGALFVEPGGNIALFGDGHRVRGLGYSPGGFVLLGPEGTPRTPVSPPGVGTFGSVTMGADGSFLAAGGNGEEPASATILRLGPEGQILHQVSFTEGQVYRVQLIGETDEGAALAEEDGDLVRLLADDSAVDPAFRGDLVPCPRGDGVGGYDRALPAPEGKILLAGECGVVRIDPDGSPDSGFAAAVPAETKLEKVAVGPGGSVLYATWNEAAKAAEVVRLGPGGAPDPSFGDDGRAAVHLRTQGYSAAGAVISLPDGDLLAAGGAALGPDRRGFALARYDARGRLDRAFGQGGRVFDSEGGLGAARAVARTPDGELVAVGTSAGSEGGGTGQAAFALAEFHPSGRPDRGFGHDGVVVDQISPARGQYSAIDAVAVQPDGRIVVAGLSEGCGRHGGVCFTVARFLPGGAIDRLFARRGVLRLPGTRGSATALALAPEGKIVVAGGEGGSFLTVRLDSRGRLDQGFNHRGIVERPARIRFHQNGHEVVDLGLGVDAMTVARDGAVTVAGGSRSAHSLIERYLPDGKTDGRFGRHGQVYLPDIGITSLSATRCGLVAGGTIDRSGSEPQMSVAGIAPDGRRASSPRPLFGALRASSGAAIAVGGRSVVVAGSVRAFEGSSEFALGAVGLGSLLPSCDGRIPVDQGRPSSRREANGRGRNSFS